MSFNAEDAALLSISPIRLGSLNAFTLSWIVVGGLFSLLLGRAIYNVFFSPLARFPGPYSRAAWMIPQALSLLRGTDVKDHLKLHRQYGHIVRTGPNTLSFTDPRAWDDIHGASADRTVPKCDKDWAFYAEGLDVPYIQNSLLALRGRHHAKVKQVLAYGFSDRSIRLYEEFMQEHLGTLVKSISENADKDSPVDLNLLYNAMSFDTIGKIVLHDDLRQLAEMQFASWSSSWQDALKYGGFILTLLSSPMLRAMIMSVIPMRFLEASSSQFGFAADRMERVLEEDASGRSMWNQIRRATGPDMGLSKAEIDANATLLLMAGSETIGALLSGVTFHLLKNDRAMKALQSEIRSKFADAQDITIDSISRDTIPYLAACIEEALRLYPPAPVGLPRMTPKSGAVIAGEYIPGNVRVYIPHCASSRSSGNFTDPNNFIPERWLDPSSSNHIFAADNKAAHQPFSLGPHTCPGRSLAIMEAKLVLTRVLWSLDLQICAHSLDWDDQQVYVVWDRRKRLDVLVRDRGSNRVLQAA